MRTRTRRAGKALVRRAGRAVDAADRLYTRAWRGVTTPEERMAQVFPECPPQGPPALGPLPAPADPSRFCFNYVDTTVPPGVALDAWRRMRR